MSWPSERELGLAVRQFLGQVCGGRLAHLWTDNGPTATALQYIEKGGPFSRGEQICLKVAFDAWNGHGGASLNDLLNVLDAKNLAAVIDLVACLRSEAIGHVQAMPRSPAETRSPHT